MCIRDRIAHRPFERFKGLDWKLSGSVPARFILCLAIFSRAFDAMRFNPATNLSREMETFGPLSCIGPSQAALVVSEATSKEVFLDRAALMHRLVSNGHSVTSIKSSIAVRFLGAALGPACGCSRLAGVTTVVPFCSLFSIELNCGSTVVISVVVAAIVVASPCAAYCVVTSLLDFSAAAAVTTVVVADVVGNASTSVVAGGVTDSGSSISSSRKETDDAEENTFFHDDIQRDRRRRFRSKMGRPG